MDIHRSRFIPYPSSAINSLAFSAANDHELSKGGLKNLRLAVGRANGDIEIWNPLKGAWHQERVFHGGKDRSIEGVVWIQEPNEFDGDGKVSSIGQLRLFSIGYSNAVTEWDLASGLPLRQSSGNLSEAWCFAAQPRMHSDEIRKAIAAGKPCGQDIVVGCADGSVALLSTADNDLHYQKYIARPHAQHARALSVAFKDRNIVAVGFTNSTFRIYDIRTSTLVRNVSLGAGAKGGPRNLHVWALRWLPNGDIVSADSAGEVRFFDGKLFGQYQRVKSHNGDILTIAVNQSGTRVFTAGIDRRTCVFSKSSNSRQWVKLRHHFYHEHDVKALAVYDGNKSQQMSFLASGGVDTNLSIIPVQQHGQEYHRGISGLPQQPPITSSTKARLVASWHGQEVTIWKIKSRRNKANDQKMHRLVARIALQGEESIAEAVISTDGHLLAVTTVSETRLFKLSLPASTSNDSLSVQKVDVDMPLPGGHVVRLSPNRKWLSILIPSNDVLLYRLVDAEDTTQVTKLPFLLTKLKRGLDSSSLQSHRKAITRMRFSPDSNVLVVTDMSGFIDCWKLEGEEDISAPSVEVQDDSDNDSDSSSSDDAEDEEIPLKSYGQYWSRMESSRELPQLDSSALVFSFRPGKKVRARQQNGTSEGQVNGTSETHPIAEQNEGSDDEDLVEQPTTTYELFILTASHQLYEFDLATGRLTDWSRRNPPEHLPLTFQKIKDRAMGCYWHTTPDSQRLYLYGSNWLFMFDVSQDLEADTDDPEKENGLIVKTKKRKWEGESGAGDKIREEDYTGFKPSVQNSDQVKKKKKREQKSADGDVEEEEADAGVQDDGMARSSRRTWHSFAYRPILAVVPLRETASYIETILVERPLWELDLPPRLAGPHDKAK